MATTETLTTQDLARLLHILPETVARKLRKGQIPGRKIGKRWLVSPAEVERLFARSPSTTAAGEPA